MSGGEIVLLVILSYVGVGFGVALARGLEEEPNAVGVGCVWPLYLVLEAIKAVKELIKEFKELKESFNSKK